MPTPNHDSSAVAVAVNPIDEVSNKRRRHIARALIPVVVLFAAIALTAVDANAANTCTLTSTSPVTLWVDPTKWSGCGGTYPGQGAGDTAIVSLGGAYTLKVDSFVNPVTLQVSTNVPIQIASGGTLTLETSSTATTGDTFTIDSGGTMATNSGANITNFFGNVTVNGGTFNSQGSIQFGGTSLFSFDGGTLSGSGTITTGSAQFTGTVGAMSINGTTFNDSSVLSFTSTSNPLTLSGGAKLNILGSASFSVLSDAAINGTAAETISIASAGTMQKTSGTGFNTISPFVKNDGTVTVAGAGVGGGFGFSGNGTHSGAFVTGSTSQTIAFGGSNTFNSGASFTGATPIKFISGTQTFNAAVTASGGLKWAGGTIAGTGPLTISGTSSLDGSNSGMILTGVINNTGAMTYSPTVITNLLTINGASAKLETTSGSFTIAGDFDIQAVPSGAGMLRVTGGTGSITKSAGTVGSSILAYVDNASGTVTNNATGALNFAGGGKSNGTMSVPTASNTMNFTNGTFDNSGTFSGAGTVNVAGGTLNINNTLSFGGGSPNFNLNGGTLGGTGTVTILSAMNWTSGTITGTSPFNVSPPAAVAITGSLGPMTLDGRVFNDNSSVVYNSPTNNLTLKNSASILIGSGATFTGIGSGTIDTDGSAVSITNNGQFSKTNSSLLIVKPQFNNNGTGVSITGGVLALDGDGTSTAAWTMSAGTEVWFPVPASQTYTWAPGTTFSGGKVTIDAGNVATTAAMTINNTSLELNGGTLTTPAAFTISAPATFKWKSGTLAGAGHTVITSGTTFDMLTESGARSMTTHTIDNAGNATMSALTQPISLDSSSVFNNSGTLDIQSDGSMLTDNVGINLFNNTGSVKKSAGGSGFRFDVKYTQSAGTTDANSLASGSTIIFNNGGTLSGGALQATSSTNFVDFFNGTFNVNGGTFAGPGALRLVGGILNINTPFTFPSLFNESSGSLGGTSTITIPNAAIFNWSGGTITGGAAAPITIQSGGAMNADTTSSSLIYDTRPLVINSGGNFNWNSGANAIIFQSGAPVSVAGGFNVATNGTLGNLAAGSFAVTGTFQHTVAGTLNVTLPLNVQSGGTITSSGAGVVNLLNTSGVSHAGTFDAQSSSFIDFAAGTNQLNAGAAFSAGTGTYKVAGGTLNLNTNVSAPNFALLSGSIVGSGNLDTTSNFSWSGGQMAGTGTTTIASGIGSFTTGPLTLNRNLAISGNTTMNAPSGLSVQTTATVTNNATFDVQSGDVACVACTTASFVNNSTIQKNAISTTNWSVPVSGAGTANVTGGNLWFQAAANLSSIFLNGGTVQFSGSPVTIGSVSAPGLSTLIVSGGSTTVSGGISGTGCALQVTGGTLTINGLSALDTLSLSGGTLTGAGALTFTGISGNNWTGGILSGSGPVTINAGMNITGSNSAMTLNRNLTNDGTIFYNPASASQVLTVTAPASITNNGTFHIVGGFDLLGVGSPVFTNASSGTLDRSTGASSAINFGPAFVNAGNSTWSLGTTTFTNGYSQTAGTTTLTSATIGSPAPLNFTGGSFTAKGTVNGSVIINGATFNPGNSPGSVTISGDYTQSSTGILNAELNGTAAGTSYDQVIVGGNVNLNGTLNATLSFTPANNDQFDVLTYAGTRSGDFATYNLPTFAGGGSFQKAYVSGTPNVLRLTAVVTASDLQIAQSAPATLLHNQTGTWTLTITNGPTPVTNVVVTDTFANASFVTATSVGPCTPSGSTVTCNLGSLAANQSVNVSLQLSAPNLVTISNSASVTATEFDPNTANNNTGNAFTPVLPSADLSITNTPSGNPVNAGSPLAFAIVVSNGGPDAVSGITVANTFPSGVTSFTFSGTGWTCGSLSGSTATCSNAVSLANGGSTPALTLSMTAPATGPAVDSATVSTSTADPNSGNNTASQSVTVLAQADLAISKSGPASVTAGQNITYTITVTNNGPSNAASVSVTDPTPAGVTFVSNSGGCTTTYPCSLGTLANGQSVTITSTYSTTPASGGSTITNTATVSSAVTADPVSTNNNATKITTINASADLAITKAGPPSSSPGSPLVYTITVTNNGPSDAAAVSVADPTPAGTTFVSNSGACTTPFPCALGTMTAGQTKTITSTFTTAANFAGTSVANSASVSSTTSDPSAANNSATATTSFGAASADLAVMKTGPSSATNGSTAAYTITVTNNGPAVATNVVLSDPAPAGLSFTSAGSPCITGFPCSLGTMTAGQSITVTASYTVTATSGSVTNTAFVSGSSFDPLSGNDNSGATTTIGASTCNAQPPALIAPANGATITSPVTFSWSAVAGATSYKVFASIGGASTQEIGSTTNTSITLPVAAGNVSWFVQALGIDNCSQLVSSTRTFIVCSGGVAPLLSVVGTSSSGQSYTVQWSDVAGVATYELQEAGTDAFDNPTTFQVSGTSRAFTKSATAATAFFYRVRALSACGQGPGPFSTSQRVVVVPVTPINAQSPSATVDINNKHVVVQTVFIPGQGAAIPFLATTDEPWLTVTPSSGILPAAGLTLSVSADPADLPNGTFTATIIVTFPGSPSKVGALDNKPPVTVPVSISVVTPVSPTTISTPSANSLIIPAVGHLDGINSQWRSDVRITNTAAQKLSYLLRFTPAGGDPSAVKQTQVSISSNDTMALDDIVKNWYGVGALGDAANGVLEIRPLNTSSKGSPNAEDVNVSFVTVASSRTFNQSAGGTLGQYMPAVPFANFVGKVTGDARAGILSLQQIAQSPTYRTNLGIVEAAGKSASVLVSVFDASGKNVLDIPIDLKPGEQQQLNSFLAAKNITLTDGRVEVKVTGGDGKITAYASVVDNRTTDPLLVSGVPLVQTPSRTFVMPGVADISNGLANWRTDLRIFNAGVDPQYVTMTLYPVNDANGATLSRSLTVNPGEITVLDNIVASRFGVTNFGGAMHVDTLTDANLVVTGRTYNQVDGGGTYGQFVAAVTPADAAAKGSRTLNVLQVEDSTRYRTNLGIVEVSGKPVTVEVSVFLPDAKVAPKVTIPLAANEYRQFRVLQQLGVGTAYNARIAIRVIDGEGRITAYGSVIDMQTQDPTYVPAQ